MREKGIPFSQAGRTGEPQLFYQAVLQGLVRPLDPALRLARIGADNLDVERVQRTPELGHAVAADCPLVIDAKDPVLVAVEGHRFAPGLQISPGRMEIRERRLALDKVKVHQPARRIVDKHQQGALRPAILKPPMLAAVDLNQLADALAPRTGLVNPFQALLAVDPQPVSDHPLAQRLPTESNPVQLAQLLRRQGRAEIPIAFANDRQRRGPKLGGLAPVARTTTPLRDQAGRTLGPINLQKPKYLTPLKPQQLGCRCRRQSSLIQISQHLEPRKLLVAHQPYRHSRHLPKNPRECHVYLAEE